VRGRVETTDLARDDLHQIWAHIASHNVSAADRMLRKLSAAFDLLTTFSGMGTDRPDLGGYLRSWPVKPYLIFFRKSPDGIIVVRVLHGARDVSESDFH
jgi:toxin ParE1/3/4